MATTGDGAERVAVALRGPCSTHGRTHRLGILPFAYGGGRPNSSHGSSEYVGEAALRRCAAVYARIARAYS